jgi:hypothetical protein
VYRNRLRRDPKPLHSGPGAPSLLPAAGLSFLSASTLLTLSIPAEPMPVGGIWADDFDRKMADVFLVQDEIVGQIVGKIAAGYGVIENTEAKSATRKSPEQVQAYDLVLRARETMQWDWTSDNFRAAREALNRPAWKKLQAQLPDASAKTFEDWWRLWNMPEADIAKLMDGVHKSAVLGAEG